MRLSLVLLLCLVCLILLIVVLVWKASTKRQREGLSIPQSCSSFLSSNLGSIAQFFNQQVSKFRFQNALVTRANYNYTTGYSHIPDNPDPYGAHGLDTSFPWHATVYWNQATISNCSVSNVSTTINGDIIFTLNFNMNVPISVAFDDCDGIDASKCTCVGSAGCPSFNCKYFCNYCPALPTAQCKRVANASANAIVNNVNVQCMMHPQPNYDFSQFFTSTVSPVSYTLTNISRNNSLQPSSCASQCSNAAAASAIVSQLGVMIDTMITVAGQSFLITELTSGIGVMVSTFIASAGQGLINNSGIYWLFKNIYACGTNFCNTELWSFTSPHNEGTYQTGLVSNPSPPCTFWLSMLTYLDAVNADGSVTFNNDNQTTASPNVANGIVGFNVDGCRLNPQLLCSINPNPGTLSAIPINDPYGIWQDIASGLQYQWNSDGTAAPINCSNGVECYETITIVINPPIWTMTINPVTIQAVTLCNHSNWGIVINGEHFSNLSPTVTQTKPCGSCSFNLGNTTLSFGKGTVDSNGNTTITWNPTIQNCTETLSPTADGTLTSKCIKGGAVVTPSGTISQNTCSAPVKTYSASVSTFSVGDSVIWTCINNCSDVPSIVWKRIS